MCSKFSMTDWHRFICQKQSTKPNLTRIFVWKKSFFKSWISGKAIIFPNPPNILVVKKNLKLPCLYKNCFCESSSLRNANKAFFFKLFYKMHNVERSKDRVIKRWSEAESFTIFENHVYTSKKNLTFAINFEATPFLVGSFFWCFTSKSLQ